MIKKVGCAFCDYKDNEVIVYDDKFCYAVISRNPINKHHVLVIPKQHYKDFVELPRKLAAHLFLVTQKLSAAVRSVCRPDAVEHISDDDLTGTGINLVEHYKIHIIPRFKNDKVKHDWSHARNSATLKTRARFAKEIKNRLK